jgi:hypothetical protein
MENVGIFYGHLIYFTEYFGIFVVIWYVVPRKIWQPCHTGVLDSNNARNFLELFSRQNIKARSKSYDFRIYSYNASVVPSRL